MINQQKIKPGQPDKSTSLSRRGLLGAGAACIGGALLPRTGMAAIPGGGGEQQDVIFDILKDGDRVGAHKLSITQQGARMLVDVRVRMKVKVGFLTAFSYAHRDREEWDGNRLVRLDARTENNGREDFVTAHRAENGLLVTSSNGKYIAPADVMSSSYWRFETVRQSSLLNTQTGQLTDIRVRDCGEDRLQYYGHEIAAHHFLLQGKKLDCDIWYGARNGQWLGLAFKTHGADITYRPREETVISAL